MKDSIHARVFAPKGQLRIAQRFIAGMWNDAGTDSPVGTIDRNAPITAQSSLRDCPSCSSGCPSDKSLGYSQSSLRDERHHRTRRVRATFLLAVLIFLSVTARAEDNAKLPEAIKPLPWLSSLAEGKRHAAADRKPL